MNINMNQQIALLNFYNQKLLEYQKMVLIDSIRKADLEARYSMLKQSDIIEKEQLLKEIEKIEKDPEGIDNSSVGDQDAAFSAGMLDNTSVTEAQDNAFNVVPNTSDNEGGGFFSKFKNMFKSKPANNEYMPISAQSQAGGSNIIDNSVKTVNQNNQTQSTGLSSRNDDATIFRTSDIAV